MLWHYFVKFSICKVANAAAIVLEIDDVSMSALVMGCLHDPANVQQTSSKCIQNTRANAGRLLDRINTL